MPFFEKWVCIFRRCIPAKWPSKIEEAMKKATAYAVAFRRIYDGQSLASLECPGSFIELWDFDRPGLGRISLDSHSRRPELVSLGSSLFMESLGVAGCLPISNCYAVRIYVKNVRFTEKAPCKNPQSGSAISMKLRKTILPA